MLRTLVITAALAASKESDTDAAYKRSRLVYEAKKNEPFALVFENPYAEPRELYWIGAEPSLMGTIEPGGEFNVNTYEGHAFGWRPPAQSETCTTDELEGTVHAARGMERHVFGEKPRVLDAHARKREQERDDPFEAHFTNRAAYGHEERVADGRRGAGRDAHLVRKEGRALRLDVGRRRAVVQERHRVLRPEEARLQRGAPHGVMCGEDAALGARARRRVPR